MSRTQQIDSLVRYVYKAPTESVGALLRGDGNLSGTGTIYVVFPEPSAQPEVLVDAGSGQFGVDPWMAAANDQQWLAEQGEFLDLASAADREALDQDQ